jgi:hypothetical protein
MTRLRRLIAAALVDSFGLSLGWTVFSLHVVGGHGLAGLGLCNAAMLCGVALSAPAAARLSAHLDGRALLRTTAVTEAALRVGTFTLLLAGAPLPTVAAAVAASNVVAWTGYAGMRAEVAAADPRGAAMTWYMVSVAAIEAAGTATAALLPRGPAGLVSGTLLATVITCYGACLLPTWLVAAGARVGRSPRASRVVGVGEVREGSGVGGRRRGGGAARRRRDGGRLLDPGALRGSGPLGHLRGARPRPLAGLQRMLGIPGLSGPLAGLQVSGGLVMLLGSGPTLLAVGLAAQLHGTRWVAGSALAFALGSLLAPSAVARLERRAIPPAVAWPALGVGMVAGWTFAAWHPAALLAAQLLSGMCMSALEGDMDARVAAGLASPYGGAGRSSPYRAAGGLRPSEATVGLDSPGTTAGMASSSTNTDPNSSGAGTDPSPSGATVGLGPTHGLTASPDAPHNVTASPVTPHGVTAGLASAAALRAFGSAAAVALAPRVIAEAGIGGLSVALATLLLGAMVVTVAWHRSQASLPSPGPVAHPG